MKVKYNYKPGIQGYSLKGATGDVGTQGHSIYYTSFSIIDDEEHIIDLLKNNKLLGEIDENNDTIYQQNDIIIDKYAMMYILSINDDEYNLTYIGNIINQSRLENEQTKLDIRDDISLEIDSTEIKKENSYNNYNENCPLHRHKIENEIIQGFVLKMNDELIGYIKGNPSFVHKIVILHNCGLSQTWTINDPDENKFFIDYRYIQMTTKTEYASTDISEIKSNIINIINEKCSCYFEVDIPNYGTYRKKITVDNEL